MSEVLMRSRSVSWDSEPATLAGLALLLGNYRCAQMLHCSPWKFALHLPEWREVGLTTATLRQLVQVGHVEYRHRLPAEFERAAPPVPWGQEREGYVVLTPAGARSARERLRAVRDEQSAVEDFPERADADPTPHWDGLVRELTLGRRLIKRFRRPAPNQECILMAFEGHGWPERIDDPLPRDHSIGSAVRLRETIKSLNHGQTQGLLRFVLESGGRGIRWKLVE
jgi:hypothetical protein